jgi:hypothetical protein
MLAEIGTQAISTFTCKLLGVPSQWQMHCACVEAGFAPRLLRASFAAEAQKERRWRQSAWMYVRALTVPCWMEPPFPIDSKTTAVATCWRLIACGRHQGCGSSGIADPAAKCPEPPADNWPRSGTDAIKTTWSKIHDIIHRMDTPYQITALPRLVLK